MQFKRISPECGIGACPSVFEAENGDLVITGLSLNAEERSAVEGLDAAKERQCASRKRSSPN